MATNEERIKKICDECGFSVFTSDANWPEFKPLLEKLIDRLILEEPMLRLTNDELVDIAHETTGTLTRDGAIALGRTILTRASRGANAG